MNFSPTETITAISTPEGVGALAIIRISGPESRNILKKIFIPNNPHLNVESIDPNHAVVGKIVNLKSKDFIDQAVITFFKAPHSYTGEDLIEVSIHGSEYIKKIVLRTITESGARPAEPGEFTKRAFLNGKIDLIQAEAIANLISSTTEKAYTLAKRHLQGYLSNDIQEIILHLISLKAKLELQIDFSEDFIEPFPKKALITEAKKVKKKIIELRNSFSKGRMINNGFLVTIIGKPNVGKSSLLNLLIKKDRAIVTHFPGTTRDTVEEVLNLKGIPVKIIDTAGIHESDEPIEEEGIKRSKEAISESDFLIGMFDLNSPFTKEDKKILAYLKEKTRFIILLNKSDIISPDRINRYMKDNNLKDSIVFSSKTGKGFDLLLKHLEKELLNQSSRIEDTAIITEERHFNHLTEALSFIEQALNNLKIDSSPELPSEDITFALEEIKQITGVNIQTDVLNEIFSKFCIGK
ncbi:MAG TPA: tRNA uridine-5-carboxymethylaminomethyl(34) synthesis GTPase MnmE [Firmicutes bacterium]|nr:tRNA uridine-5-carboxymethylaminomethyl(34) synthesis GTPase MnmE [Bacillota bacterium]